MKTVYSIIAIESNIILKILITLPQAMASQLIYMKKVV